MKVIFINKQKKIHLESALLKKIAVYVADKFDSSKSTELNIVFVEPDEISELNRKYRNVTGPTDVLSFSYRESAVPDSFKGSSNEAEMIDSYGFNMAGEIIICPEIAATNAHTRSSANLSSSIARTSSTDIKEINLEKPQKDWSVLKEISLLIIHGVLHLYDYDHENDSDFESMESIQNTIFKDVLLRFFPT